MKTARPIRPKKLGHLFAGPREIEIDAMNAGLAAGTLKETERGDENRYFLRSDGRRVFCKCL